MTNPSDLQKNTEDTSPGLQASPKDPNSQKHRVFFQQFQFQVPPTETTNKLTLIKGINSTIEALLNCAGVRSYRQLLQLTPMGIAELLCGLEGITWERIAKEKWLTQAANLAVTSALSSEKNTSTASEKRPVEYLSPLQRFHSEVLDSPDPDSPSLTPEHTTPEHATHHTTPEHTTPEHATHHTTPEHTTPEHATHHTTPTTEHTTLEKEQSDLALQPETQVSFTVHVRKGEKGSVTRTSAVHIGTGASQIWREWPGEELLRFLEDHASISPRKISSHSSSTEETAHADTDATNETHAEAVPASLIALALIRHNRGIISSGYPIDLQVAFSGHIFSADALSNSFSDQVCQEGAPQLHVDISIYARPVEGGQSTEVATTSAFTHSTEYIRFSLQTEPLPVDIYLIEAAVAVSLTQGDWKEAILDTLPDLTITVGPNVAQTDRPLSAREQISALRSH